jgi:hypothetical protein
MSPTHTHASMAAGTTPSTQMGWSRKSYDVQLPNPIICVH